MLTKITINKMTNYNFCNNKLQRAKIYLLLGFPLCFLALKKMEQEIINVVVITTEMTMMIVKLADFLSSFPAKTRTIV